MPKTTAIDEIPVSIDPKARPFLKGFLEEALNDLPHAIADAAWEEGVSVDHIRVQYHSLLEDSGGPFISMTVNAKAGQPRAKLDSMKHRVYGKLEEWLGPKGSHRYESYGDDLFLRFEEA